MIIDAHAHIYPENIAAKASAGVGGFYGGAPMQFDGTASTLLQAGERAGISRYLVQSVATKPHQVQTINRFIAAAVQQHPQAFIGFATLHPDCEDIPALIQEAQQLGLVGIKLHPDFQRFLADSDAAMQIYAAIAGKMPLLIHAGDYRTQFSKPQRLVRVMEAFPELDMIAAHFGGWSEWGSYAPQLAKHGVYVDTSSSLYAMTPIRIREMIDIFGADHVFLGSDYPMFDIADEIKMLEQVPMTQEERAGIYSGNLLRLLAKYGYSVSG